MKKIGLVLAASALALSLVACGGSKKPSASSSSAPENAKSGNGFKTNLIKVNIWDNNQRAGLQKIADEWSAKTGVKVNIEVVDWNNYWTLLEAGASGGEMPDVFWMHSNTVQMYMENDLLLNLDPYIASNNVDMSKYYDGIKNLYTRKDGKVFALPKDHDTIALLYNKAIFDKYGVEYPNDNWTYEDMYKAAKKITEASKGDVYGYGIDTSNNQDGWYNIVYAYGGQVITDNHKGTTIASKEGKAGMEMVRKLLTVSAPQSVMSETGADSLFQSGKLAMTTQGSWMINFFYTAENSKDYAWAMLPYADLNNNGKCERNERWSTYNGLGWSASHNTKDPNAAWSLISYFCAEAGQREQAKLGVTMAGIPGVSADFANAFSGMDVSAFTKIEEEGTLFFRPYTRNTPVWEDALKQQGGFLDAWLNPADSALMAKACDNAQAIIEKAIAQE